MKQLLKLLLPILTALGVFLGATYLSPVHAAANSVWFQPGSGNHTIGQSFTVTVYGSTDANFGAPSTAITVKYPSNLVSVTNVSNAGTIPSAVLTHNTESHTVSFAHSFYGYSAGLTNAPLFKITLRATNAGNAALSFTSTFLRGHTVNGVSSTYALAAPTCHQWRLGCIALSCAVHLLADAVHLNAHSYDKYAQHKCTRLIEHAKNDSEYKESIHQGRRSNPRI